MTSLEMLREFKVGMDKIDSQSYPEIYDEQIFMYINRYINKIVNEGRKVFEETQQITDNLKSMIPVRPTVIIPTISPVDNTAYEFNLTSATDYLFYIRSSATTKPKNSTISGKASTKISQQDDIEALLVDPFNKPKPYKIPITFTRNSIVGYSDGTFDILNLRLWYVKKPALVSATVDCDLDEQLHYSIVEGAMTIAIDALGINKQELNN